MQDNKIDTNQIIGFGLMMLIFLGWFLWTQPGEEEIAAEKERQEQLAQEQQEAEKSSQVTEQQEVVADSIAQNLKTFTLENEHILIEFSNRGAQLSKVHLKDYTEYNDQDGSHNLPLLLFDKGNANWALKFDDAQGRQIDLSKRIFSGQQQGNSVVFTTQENGGEIKYIYTLNGDFDLDYQIQTKNIAQISPKQEMGVDFNFKAISQEKGKSWEQRTTDFHYSLNNYSDEDYSRSDFEADADETLDWAAFKQQFFATVLEKEGGMKSVKAEVVQPENDSVYSKYFTFSMPLKASGEMNEKFTWHFLPLDFDLLKEYNKDFDEIVPFGWMIFGWINEWIILPIFKFMMTWGLEFGWIIALLTIFVKLVTAPIMYRQYRQSAMMRVLKPDMEALSEKYKGSENAMKKQQEVMALYRTAGVNPLAGCLPALLQLPIFYALFNFFPNVIQLRGKSFLWADDLTAYDSILDFGFDIPFYGDHVSLFALLYVITMVIYFRISGTANMQTQQEGMPDMRFIMYLMPVMFIFFLNSYASGLSWYYFVSNAINIGLVFVIKNWIIDDDKIHAKIQANKAKPKSKKKKSKWAQRLDDAMKKAQEQQKQNKK